MRQQARGAVGCGRISVRAFSTAPRAAFARPPPSPRSAVRRGATAPRRSPSIPLRRHQRPELFKSTACAPADSFPSSSPARCSCRPWIRRSAGTSIPPIAAALNEPPLRLHLAITSYTLSLAAFLPLSGWLADRVGARRVFRTAIVIFTLASAVCGMAQNLDMLLAARVAQGIGGAMMVPVGRLLLVRTVDKSELIKAMTLMTMPALLGPIIGPPLGGLITTLGSWRWIFWVNLPIGLLGFILVGLFIAEIKSETVRRFDFRGFILSGLGLSFTVFGADTALTQTMPVAVSLGFLGAGIVLLGLLSNPRQAQRPPDPRPFHCCVSRHSRASITGGHGLPHRDRGDAVPAFRFFCRKASATPPCSLDWSPVHHQPGLLASAASPAGCSAGSASAECSS